MSVIFSGIIDEVLNDPYKLPPLIVNFATKDNENSEEQNVENKECKLMYNGKRKKHVLAMETKRGVYRSCKADVENRATVLVIRNKFTDKIRLVRAERCHMVPVLEESLQEDNEKVEKLNQSLASAFGSKKMQKNEALKSSMEVDYDLFRQNVEDSINDIKVDESVCEDETMIDDENDENKIIEADKSKSIDYLPPCYEDAEQLKDVYKLDDIIPKHLLHKLYDYAKYAIKHGLSKNTNSYFQEIFDKTDEPKRKKKLAVLIYAIAICKWLDIKKWTNIRLVEEQLSLPEEVYKHMIDTFTIRNDKTKRRLRPLSLKYKAVVHCIIIVLLLNNFEINIQEFCKVFNSSISLSRCRSLVKLIGLRIIRGKRYMYHLQLPLPKRKPIATERV